MSAKDSARIFAERNGITTAPEIARMEPQKPDDPTSVEILTWSARGKPISRLYTVHAGGHVIPQPVLRFPRLFGKTTSALDAPSAAWHNAFRGQSSFVGFHGGLSLDKTKAFVETLGDKLRLFFLPPYSPDRNPDGWCGNSHIAAYL
jgi:hypothetical protein